MLSWVHIWTTSWSVHDLNILLVQKGCRVTCCMGRGIVLEVHKVTSKHPCRPWQHLIPQDLDVPMPVHGSIHQDKLASPPMVDCTPYYDWQTTISIIRTQASISISPCLWRPRTRPSLLYRENRDSSLNIQCIHCLRSQTLCLLHHSRQRRLCSKVSLGHLAGCRNQYPAARSLLRMVRTDICLPNRQIICIHRRSWSGSFWPVVVTVFCDDSRFSLHHKVMCVIGKWEMIDCCVALERSIGKHGLSVWVAILHGASSDPLVLEDSMNRHHYIEILRDQLLR